MLDYTSYFLFVQAQNVALKSMWEAQVAKAQWKAPCAAQGRMECTAGHKLKMEPAIICDKKVHFPAYFQNVLLTCSD